MACEITQLSLAEIIIRVYHLFFNKLQNNAVATSDDRFVFDIHPSLLVDLNKLTIGEMIGEGSGSVVYKGLYENLPVAIKAILPERTKDATSECKEKFQREVKLMARIRHKNIVKFIGASVEPSMMIITELLEGGSLQKNMSSTYPMALEQSLWFALDISQAMEYLHAKGIIHRDLKPGNLLLTKDKERVKLADFGIARAAISDEMTSEAGTYRYMAPELLSKDSLGPKMRYDCKVDVFSFAMVLWSLIKNQIPFKGRNGMAAAYATINNLRPSVEEFPPHVVPLLQSCWEEDPKLRPEFKEITKTLEVLIKKRVWLAVLPTIPEVEAEEEDHNDSNNGGGEVEEETAPKPQDGHQTLASLMMEETSKHGAVTETNKPAATEGEFESQPETTETQSTLCGKAKKKSKLKRLLNRLWSFFAMPACNKNKKHVG